MEIPEPIAKECHRSSRPAAGDEPTGDERVEESSEKEEMEGG